MWAKIKETTTGILQWVKVNLIFCGGVLVSILLAFVTYWKRRATTAETRLETQEKRNEVEKAHEETKRAEKDYEEQKDAYKSALDEYNRKYRSGK